MKTLNFALSALLICTLAGCNTRSVPADTQSTQSSQRTGVVYAATDLAINSDVKAKLAADENVGPMELDTQTQNKVVTLSGTVDSPATEDKAMMAARQVNGVSSVVDKMKVGGPGCCKHKGQPMQGHGDGKGQPMQSHGDGMGMQHGTPR